MFPAERRGLTGAYTAVVYLRIKKEDCSAGVSHNNSVLPLWAKDVVSWLFCNILGSSRYLGEENCWLTDFGQRWGGQSQESARKKRIRVLIQFLIEILYNGNFPAIAWDRAI